jgi:GAF domain-containing protein
VADFPLAPNESARLRVLHASGIMDGPPIPALDALCVEAARHFGVKTAIVTLLDADIQVLKAKVGIADTTTPRNVAFCNYTILEDRVFVVPDATADARFATNPLVTGAPFIRFYAGAPLVFQQDVRLGALCLLHPEPRAFTLGDRAELLEMAERAVNLIADFWFEIDAHR